MEKSGGKNFSVKAQLLKKGAVLPEKQSAGSAGFDIRACMDAPLELAPLERAAIPTGIALEIPLGYEGQVRPRSGLARNKGVTVLNSPGTIDSDYRGEIHIIVINLGKESVTIQNGDRIAQLVFSPVQNAVIHVTDTLSVTERGGKGFGSTGL
ncbi:MAG: dUTP diphosphatase [Spirochaetaceae bacterium]|jgi:dUTP pyrophosphatase|nr:dUTP diphosphatase [Spirochaetaceae bacterium]